MSLSQETLLRSEASKVEMNIEINRQGKRPGQLELRAKDDPERLKRVGTT